MCVTRGSRVHSTGWSATDNHTFPRYAFLVMSRTSRRDITLSIPESSRGARLVLERKECRAMERNGEKWCAWRCIWRGSAWEIVGDRVDCAAAWLHAGRSCERSRMEPWSTLGFWESCDWREIERSTVSLSLSPSLITAPFGPFSSPVYFFHLLCCSPPSHPFLVSSRHCT